MIKDRNIAPNANIHPSKILGGSLGVKDYFHVAPVDSSYYEWLLETVPADRLFHSMADAYANMTADRGDTMLLYPGSYSQAAAFAWSKDQTHLIGVGAKYKMEHICEITCADAATIATTGGIVAISGNECSFENVCFRHRGAVTILCNVAITGDDNVFTNVHFHNAANAATAGADTTGVVLDGAKNTIFRNCVFGGTEIERTVASQAEVTIGAGTCDNLFFYDCLWIADLDGTADGDWAGIETVADPDLAKFMYLENPIFVNAGAAAAVPDALTVGAALAGEVVIMNPMIVSVTDIADNEEKVWILSEKDTTGGKFTGIAIHPDVT